MNEAKGKVGGFNFKKAFIIFFAALLAFIAITVIHGLSTGGWQEAVELQNTRREVTLSGDLSSILEFRAERAGRGQSTIGDRVLFSLARVTSSDFNAFNIIGTLFQITFVALVAAFVYSKVQNRVKGKVQNEHHQNSNNA